MTMVAEPELFEGDQAKMKGRTDLEYDMAAAVERVFADDLASPLVRLLTKLHKVYAAIDAVEKAGTNQEQHYRYVKAVDVSKDVRRQLRALGVVILPSVVSQSVLPPREGSKQWLTTVSMHFTVYDVDTGCSLEFDGAGQGADPTDKGVYKAITGALKYGLRSLFLIPDEKDDPEYDGDAVSGEANVPVSITPSNVPGVRQGGRSEHITTIQLDRIKAALKAWDRSNAEVAYMLVAEVGRGPEPYTDEMSDGEQKASILKLLKSLSFEEAATVLNHLTVKAKAS